jgi:MFS family permease
LKYFLFADLYIAEGLEMALIIFIIPIFLLEKEISLSLITIVSGVAFIPWIIKFIWGGIVDYFIRIGRKKFIIIGGLISSISLILLSFIDPFTSIFTFAFFIFLSHVGILFIDVSSDAWAIDISKKKERGKINGSMITGMTIGVSLGAGIFSVISNNIGYNFAFLAAAFFILLLVIFPLTVKERKKIKKCEKITPTLIIELKKSSTIIIAIFGFFLLINHGIQYILPLFQKTILNLDIVQIGLISNLGILSAVIGAIIGGYLSDRWGRMKVLYVFITICMIFSALLIFIRRWEDLLLYIPIAISFSAFNSAYLALAMDITNPRVGATQFSIITSFANLGEWFGTTISGGLVVMLGFNRVFLYSALALGPALLILYFMRFEKTEG